MFKKTVLFFLCLFIGIFSFEIKGESPYIFCDGNSEILSFDSQKEAEYFFEENIAEYQEPILYYQNEVLNMKYGVVSFNFIEDKISYESIYNGKAFLVKYKTPEALFLGFEKGKVKFLLNGDIGLIDKEYVNLVPYFTVRDKISKYANVNGDLIHYLNTHFDNDFYEHSLSIDKSLPYFEDNKYYYSYDNHYFYADFYQMVDDYYSLSKENAINYDTEYYNYYAYLPFRTYTNYDIDDLKAYFYSKLGINHKLSTYTDYSHDGANDVVNHSQYFDDLDAFLYYEKIYGTNALIMLGESMYESSSGKSLQAFESNNVYEHYAFDNEYQREYKRYENIESSIYAHSKYYLSKLFGGIHSSFYKGTFLGDRSSGVGVNCSNEPFYNEMVISNIYQVDKFLGFKDYCSYAQGIIKSSKIDIYKDKELNELDYSLSVGKEFVVTILSEEEDSYKIQLDNYSLDTYEYNPIIEIGYIAKDAVDLIFNEINEKEYDVVNLDYNGGTLHYDNEATLYLIDNNILPVIKPQLEGYDFVTYENFKAQYKKIDSIEFLNTPNLSFTEGEYYDMSSCEVKIMYEDNTYRKMELNTNIARIEENKLVVSYGGKEISCEINILSSELKNELRRIVDLCLHGEINLNDLAYLKNHLKQAHLDLNMSEIRMLDKIFIDNSDYNYAFRNTKADLSISGFGLSLGDHLLKNLPRPFKDTYYLQLMNVNSNIKDIAYKYANAYDFEVVDCFKMKYSLNLVSIEPDYEQVVSYKIEDDGLYTVYCYDEDKIYKCYSEISDNYLSFITRGSGTYFILRKDTINKYDFKNIQENITSINSDPDIHMFIVEGLFVLSLFVIGLCLIVMNSILDSKEKKLWNDYKKSLQKRA